MTEVRVDRHFDPSDNFTLDPVKKVSILRDRNEHPLSKNVRNTIESTKIAVTAARFLEVRKGVITWELST